MIKCPSCGEENPPKFKLCGYCGTALRAASAVPPAQDVRKTVTIVFCDLKGSTALGERLDPEALHDVKERYFRSMAAEIVRHGGKIEKYIGDAIMAVFGLPRAHEDDALRAVRAAVGMRTILATVNADLTARYGVVLANRTGVNTGEVIANSDPNADQQLATGDAVNVAARLEQAAPDDQIYLGEATYRLVRDAVEVEAVEPLELKGKAQRVPAFLLVAAPGLDGNVRRHDTPIVGRDAELATLSAVFGAVADGREIRMVTVIGEAGFGKSRLAREVVDRIGVGARVLTGRCLPYGDGITFWPLLMMVREAADIRDADSPEAARAKLLAVVGDRAITDRLASAAGLSAAAFSLDEINWAARKFLELVASTGPLVVLVDDIHWAETAFLDLLEHVLRTAADAPILLLTTARHDLLEEHANWGTQPNSIRVVLHPLSDAASAQVVANLLGSVGLQRDAVTRIVRAAEGNPLYVEHMLQMLIDSGALRVQGGQWTSTDADHEIAVPPTIHALLEARLDRLPMTERAVVGPASVIGLVFVRPAIESLAAEAVRPTIDQHLGELARKQFIHSMESDGEPLYRFHHSLVRDTVYNALLKRARADLHIEFVRWADRINAERDRALEFEEILGYHLEQAHRYLAELGPLDERGVAVGRDAAKRLSGAGRRAFARGDLRAAASLYRRALALLGERDPNRLQLMPELGETLMDLGDFARARAVLDEAEAAADRAADRRVKASAQLVRMLVGFFAETGDWSDQALPLAEGVIPLLESEAAYRELATAWRVIMFVHASACRWGKSAETANRAIAYARLAGDERLAARVAMGLSISLLLGPTPVAEAIQQCEQIVGGGLSDRQTEAKIICTLAQLRAMNGEFDAARALYRRGRELLRDLGQGVNAASTGMDLLAVERLAGDLATAEREARADYLFLERSGETSFLTSLAALLGRVVRDQGRDDEALALTQTAEQSAPADDVEAHVLWRSIRAPIVARAGDLDAAETLAREALTFAHRTEAPLLQADALCELANVLAQGQRQAEARATLDEAVGLYAAKGDVVSAARARAVAARLGPSPNALHARTEG